MQNMRLLSFSAATSLGRFLSPAPNACCSRVLNTCNTTPSTATAAADGGGGALFPRHIASASTGRTADPALYSGDSLKIDEDANPNATTDLDKTEQIPTKDNNPFVPQKPPTPSSPQLESIGVNQPIQPNTQQKRSNSAGTNPIDGATCLGLDDSPWPEEDGSKGRRQQRKEQEEDDKEYFRDHKASPLSEIEVVDTRKPITQVMQGSADGNVVGASGGVILFREEQLGTAEDALRRATEMWREAAARGDPDSPHGRVLRTLRGEWW